MTVALAQISPVWLDREETTKKVAQWIDKAAEKGAELVAFGETLVPGYPFWLAHTGGAQFDSKVALTRRVKYSPVPCPDCPMVKSQCPQTRAAFFLLLLAIRNNRHQWFVQAD